jgi:hypothetical protein
MTNRPKILSNFKKKRDFFSEFKQWSPWSKLGYLIISKFCHYLLIKISKTSIPMPKNIRNNALLVSRL